LRREVPLGDSQPADDSRQEQRVRRKPEACPAADDLLERVVEQLRPLAGRVFVSGVIADIAWASTATCGTSASQLSLT
jgi:hypothetical protein